MNKVNEPFETYSGAIVDSAGYFEFRFITPPLNSYADAVIFAGKLAQAWSKQNGNGSYKFVLDCDLDQQKQMERE